MPYINVKTQSWSSATTSSAKRRWQIPVPGSALHLYSPQVNILLDFCCFHCEYYIVTCFMLEYCGILEYLPSFHTYTKQNPPPNPTWRYGERVHQGTGGAGSQKQVKLCSCFMTVFCSYFNTVVFLFLRTLTALVQIEVGELLTLITTEQPVSPKVLSLLLSKLMF